MGNIQDELAARDGRRGGGSYVKAMSVTFLAIQLDSRLRATQ